MARIALCSILHYQMQYSSCIIALCLPWRIYLAMAAYMAFHNKEMGILCITKLFYYYSIKKGCVTMPLPQREDYTIEDIYALPEGTRAELIDGQIYYMAPPSRNHQKIAGKLLQSYLSTLTLRAVPVSLILPHLPYSKREWQKLCRARHLRNLWPKQAQR